MTVRTRLVTVIQPIHWAGVIRGDFMTCEACAVPDRCARNGRCPRASQADYDLVPAPQAPTPSSAVRRKRLQPVSPQAEKEVLEYLAQGAISFVGLCRALWPKWSKQTVRRVLQSLEARGKIGSTLLQRRRIRSDRRHKRPYKIFYQVQPEASKWHSAKPGREPGIYWSGASTKWETANDLRDGHVQLSRTEELTKLQQIRIVPIKEVRVES